VLKLIKRLPSNDRTSIKYVWGLEDKNTIESVYIRFAKYDSVCISSQVGCSLKCAFCATGLGGLLRNLDTSEIIAQVESTFEDIGAPKRDCKISFMGMGEPLLNLGSVLNAQEHLKSKYPEMRFSLSTVGIVPKIYELVNTNTDIQLQVSLHAPNDYLREKIMPITKKYPIKEVLEAAKYYALISGKILRINYLLLNGVNDSDTHADELVKLIRGLPAYLKISRFNPVSGIDMTTTSDEQHKAFEAKCSRLKLRVYQFASMGVDVEGGCGQLRAHFLTY
jgi:23S rRNA (adenine2503-C2)-methyltransferase